MEGLTNDSSFSQVEIHYTSLNKGDVFILDEGMTIHCWNGSHCSRTERMKVIVRYLKVTITLTSRKVPLERTISLCNMSNTRKFVLSDFQHREVL